MRTTKNSNGLINVEFSFYDVIHDTLDDQARINLVESLACADNIVMDTVDWLTDKYTTNGFRPSDDTVQRAKTIIAIHADKISQEAINNINKERDEYKVKYLEYVASSARYSCDADHYKKLYYQALEQLKK